jgi:hypothetical protein
VRFQERRDNPLKFWKCATKGTNSLQVLAQSEFSFCCIAPYAFPVPTSTASNSAAAAIVRKKRFPSGPCEYKNFQRIVPALFTVASSAGYQHVARDVEAHAITVHTVEMLDHRVIGGQIARAIRTSAIEPLANKFFVFFTVNFDQPVLANFAAQFVEKHANQLVRHIGLGPPRCRAQFEDWVFHFILDICPLLLSSRSSDGVMRKARLIFASVYSVTFCGEFLSRASEPTEIPSLLAKARWVRSPCASRNFRCTVFAALISKLQI